MHICDFEVLRDGAVVAARLSLVLPDIRAAWPKIAELARRYDAPGYKIRVKDEAGGIVILTGVAAVRRYAGLEMMADRVRDCGRILRPSFISTSQ